MADTQAENNMLIRIGFDKGESMTRNQAYEIAIELNKCKEKENMTKPNFIDPKVAYKNGDVIPADGRNRECIYVNYNELTHEQIWDIFYYLKKKIIKMGNVYSPVVRRDPFKIKKVHFNPPVTVVIWEDGTKTIVRTQGEDTFDPEKGLAMAISKKSLGNDGGYYDEFKKWSEPYQEELDKLNDIYAKILSSLTYNVHDAGKAIKKLTEAITKAVDNEEPNYDEVGE